MLDRLALPTLPVLLGGRVILRDSIDSDVDDRLRRTIDPGEEDGYGSSWRREWDGERWMAPSAGQFLPGPVSIADADAGCMCREGRGPTRRGRTQAAARVKASWS